MSALSNKNSNQGNTLKRKLAVNGSWAFFGKAITGVGAILIVGLLSRLLVPAELGVFFLSQSLAYFIGMVICLGLDSISIKLIAESMATEKHENVEAIVLRILSIVSSAAIVVGAIFWLVVGPFLAKNIFHSDAFLEITPLISLWLMSIGLQKTLGEMLRGFHDIRAATFFCGTLFGGVLDVVLYIPILVYSLIVFGAIDIKTALTISVAISWTSCVIAALLLRFKVKSLKVNKKNTTPVRKIINLGLPVWVSNISIASMMHTDLWVIAAFCSKEELAIYGAMTRLMKFITTTIVVVEEVVSPLIAQLNVENKKEDLEWSLQTTSAVATFISIPIFIIFALLGNYIIKVVYGDFFIEGYFVLVVLSAAQLINVWVGACAYTLTMTGNGKALMRITFSTALLAIIFAAAAAGTYGINGVAVAMASAVIMQQLVVMFYAHEHCGVWTYANFGYGFTAILNFINHVAGKR